MPKVVLAYAMYTGNYCSNKALCQTLIHDKQNITTTVHHLLIFLPNKSVNH